LGISISLIGVEITGVEIPALLFDKLCSATADEILGSSNCDVFNRSSL
jgi:hypothetical protein